jgi:hypothetical protein
MPPYGGSVRSHCITLEIVYEIRFYWPLAYPFRKELHPVARAVSPYYSSSVTIERWVFAERIS